MLFLIFDFKKNLSLEPYLNSMGFEDKGQGFPTKLFLLLKVNHGRRGGQFKKNGGFNFELKKGHKKKTFFNFFLYSDSFQPGDYHAKK